MPTELFSASPYGVIAIVAWYLINRLNHVEKRMEKAEQDIQIEKARANRLERAVELLGLAYDGAVSELKKVSRILRKGGSISAEHLDEIDSIPDKSADVLKNRLGEMKS